jgi:hypothetical protein
MVLMSCSGALLVKLNLEGSSVIGGMVEIKTRA